jgi:hypothetical protein
VRPPLLTLLTFIVVQCTDGWLTAVGIARFGAGVEANPILAWYALAIGSDRALIGAKLLAIGCAAALHVYARHRILATLTLFYVVLAIIPWILTLSL